MARTKRSFNYAAVAAQANAALGEIMNSGGSLDVRRIALESVVGYATNLIAALNKEQAYLGRQKDED